APAWPPHPGLPFIARTSPLAVFGMDVVHEHAGGDNQQDGEQHDALLLPPAEQSGATRGDGKGSSCGFGSIQLFDHSTVWSAAPWTAAHPYICDPSRRSRAPPKTGGYLPLAHGHAVPCRDQLVEDC